MDLLEEGLKRCMDKLKEKERDKVRGEETQLKGGEKNQTNKKKKQRESFRVFIAVGGRAHYRPPLQQADGLFISAEVDENPIALLRGRNILHGGRNGRVSNMLRFDFSLPSDVCSSPAETPPMLFVFWRWALLNRPSESVVRRSVLIGLVAPARGAANLLRRRRFQLLEKHAWLFQGLKLFFPLPANFGLFATFHVFVSFCSCSV